MQDVQMLRWPNAEFISTELYRLLAAVLASKPIAEAARDGAAGLEDLVDMSTAESQAISRLLVSIAANLRMLDDQNSRVLEHLDAGVGILIEEIPASPASGKPASVRDACNKIIHAESLEVERNYLSEHCSYVEPRISIYGRNRMGKRGKPKTWHLQLDIVGFVHEAMLGLVEVAYPEARQKPMPE